MNRPVTNFMRHNTAETIFDRLERCGRTWRAAAPSFGRLLSLGTPRAPETWPDIEPLPVPLFQAEQVEALRALGTLGRHVCHGFYEHARHDPDLPDPPDTDPKVSPALAIDFAVHLGARLFPRLAAHASAR